MPRIFLIDAAPGDSIDDVYVINNKQFSVTAGGKNFIKAFVSDRSSQVTARMWNASRDDFNDLPEGGFIRIRGRVENYQNNLQLIIENATFPRDGSFDVAELIPTTQKNVGEMFAKLLSILKSLRNKHLLAIVNAFLDDPDLMAKFKKAPAAMSFHHAFVGGLLEHTLNAVEVAKAITPFYPGLNGDLVIAGIFLHDIAKTWELTYECSFGYSDGGQLVGHIVKAAIWIEEKSKLASQKHGEIPRALIDTLQHLILSHHGLPEFGAAKLPATPEAIAVHVIENLDAKLMMSLGATRGDPKAGSEGNWTEYLKAFGARLYRPDPAPLDNAPEINQEPPPEPQIHPENASHVKSTPSPSPTPKTIITNPLFEAGPLRKK